MADWPAAFHDFAADEALESAWLDELVAALQAAFPVGCYRYMIAASTGSENLQNGAWLECNGASVLRADYPELNTLLNSLGYPFGTADGTHMTLPDFRGRAPWGHGSHADVNALGDSEGEGLTTRTPAHWHDNDDLAVSSAGLSITGAPSLSGAPGITGSPSGSLAGHSNPNQPGTAGVLGANGTGSGIGGLSLGKGTLAGTIGTLAAAAGSLDVSGTLSVTGDVGDDTAARDKPAYLVGGIWFLKAKP